ncbi:MAG: tight adherence protein [Nocardioidaceae bacterium]|jgi:tight adherence protein B|nr:tight adherence protein [Nocardioidaceae bacterium]
MAAGLQGPHLAVVMTAAVAAVAAVRLAAAGARARAAAARRHTVIDYCEALVGELRAGQPVLRAVERSVQAWPESEPVAVAASLGADVPEALRRLGGLPGASGLTRLAGAWTICAATGAGLAFAADQVLATARAAEATDRLVQAELASARATARLVTVLPVVVLVAAQGIGARPWAFLLSTAPGAGCLAAGVALTLTGLWWIDRIAVSAAGEV